MKYSLEEFKAKTEEWQATAWLDEPQELCGVLVDDLSLERYFILKEIGSPFLNSGTIYPEDLAIFIWVVSKEFTPCPKARKKFQEKVISVKILDAKNAIEEWLEEQFAEADTTTDNEKPFEYAHFVAIQIDILAKEYGWAIEYIMGLSLKKIIQLNSVIQHRYSKQGGQDYRKIRALDNYRFEAFFENSKN